MDNTVPHLNRVSVKTQQVLRARFSAISAPQLKSAMANLTVSVPTGQKDSAVCLVMCKHVHEAPIPVHEPKGQEAITEFCVKVIADCMHRKDITAECDRSFLAPSATVH
jgi:hypothetical protein